MKCDATARDGVGRVFVCNGGVGHRGAHHDPEEGFWTSALRRVAVRCRERNLSYSGEGDAK